ncbi:MAG TPA: hypothetical protein VFM70_05890 [Salinimicrobium sp.]|nr:hypothetical protein [Salinimicrobium sp.]
MSQIKVKPENKTRTWADRIRFRVGETVKHNGASYVNLTGANSEPGVGSDWLMVGGSTVIYYEHVLTDATSINWNSANAFLEATAAVGDTRDITFVDTPGKYSLQFKQDATGGRKLTFSNAETISGLIDLEPEAISFIELYIESNTKSHIRIKGQQPVIGETPTGVIDGVNTTFTTAKPFATGKTSLYLNGIRQHLGDDYTEVGNGAVEFIIAPEVDDKIIIDY